MSGCLYRDFQQELRGDWEGEENGGGRPRARMVTLVPGFRLFSVVVAHFGINYPATMEIGLFTLWAPISVATFEAGQATVRRTAASALQFAPQPVMAGNGEPTEEARHSSFAPFLPRSLG